MKKNVTFKLILLIMIILVLKAYSGYMKEKNQPYIRGEWFDNVYVNDFIGISFELPDDWYIESDDELFAMLEIDTKKYLDEESRKNYEEAMKLSTTVIDFAIFNNETGESTLLYVEDLSKTDNTYVTVDEYSDLLINDYISDEDYVYTVDEKKNETLGSEEYQVITIRVEDYSISKAYIRKIGKYMICLGSIQSIGIEGGAVDIIEDIRDSKNGNTSILP